MTQPAAPVTLGVPNNLGKGRLFPARVRSVAVTSEDDDRHRCVSSRRAVWWPGRRCSTVAAVQVLICDDDWRLRRLYRRHFQWEGMDVIEASDGRQCIDLAQSEQPALIVLDLSMPRQGGLSTLPHLRELCSHIPVVVVTTHASDQIFDRSRKLGAAACFTKPGFLAQIPDVVEEYAKAS